MTNNRTFWAIREIAIKSNATPPTSGVAPVNARHFITGPLASGVDQVNGLWEVPRGVQQGGKTTTLNVQQVFQLGQVELYEYSERQPDIEVTISKAVDGSKPVYFMVTDSSAGNDIVARTANYRTDVAMQIYSDTQFRATGKPISQATASGMVVSQVTYTYPIDGFVTEDITLVGNDIIWSSLVAVSGYTLGNGGTHPLGSFPSPDLQGNIDPTLPMGLPSGVFGHDGNTSAILKNQPGIFEQANPPDRFGVLVVGSGIQRRENVDIRRSVLPSEIPGMTVFAASGIDAAYVNGGFGAGGPGTPAGTSQLIGNANTDFIQEHIQTITISFSISRDDIFQQGSKRPFAKVPAFPLEATTAVECVTSQGDLVTATSAIDDGPGHDNTAQSNTIIVRTTDGMQVDLGDANKLVSIQQTGGEAGGGNMTVTYNYSSFNVFNVSHDFYQPNHRILIFETGNSRFNIGAPRFTRSVLGIF